MDHWKAMDVELQNKFLVPCSLCCPRKHLICISPSEILLYHLSLCASPLFDPVVKYVSAEKWCFLSQNGLSFWGPCVTCHLSRTFSFNILQLLYHVWDDSHRVPGRRNTNLGIISNFLTEFFFYYPLKTFSCHDCGWMRSGWMWSLLCLQKGGLLGKVSHCHPLGLLGRNE